MDMIAGPVLSCMETYNIIYTYITVINTYNNHDIKTIFGVHFGCLLMQGYELQNCTTVRRQKIFPHKPISQ